MGVGLTVLAGLVLAGKVFNVQAGETNLLSSPDGRLRVWIQMPVPGSVERPRWSATFRGKPLLSECSLGLQTADAGDLMVGARVLQERRRSVDERLPVRFGKSDHANDRFREARYTLETPLHRRADAVFRCYDDALALRYELPGGKPGASVTVANETTSFRLAGEPTAFVQYLENYRTSHEHNVIPARWRDIRRGALLDLPLTRSPSSSPSRYWRQPRATIS
jgi:hypothetical protein